MKSVFPSVQGDFGFAIDLSGDDVVISEHADNAERQFESANLFIGQGGMVKVDLLRGGTALEFNNLPDAFLFPYAVKKIYSTANGTTADLIIATINKGSRGI